MASVSDTVSYYYTGASCLQLSLTQKGFAISELSRLRLEHTISLKRIWWVQIRGHLMLRSVVPPSSPDLASRPGKPYFYLSLLRSKVPLCLCKKKTQTKIGVQTIVTQITGVKTSVLIIESFFLLTDISNFVNCSSSKLYL